MATTSEITNTEDIIDSRDVITRIEKLESEHGACCSVDCEDTHHEDDCPDECEETHYCTDCSDEDEHEELDKLKALADEAETSSVDDWPDGAALIRDSYFKEYAQEQAADIAGARSEMMQRWPFTCIDWDEAAEELQQDYVRLDFDGVTYWAGY